MTIKHDCPDCKHSWDTKDSRDDITIMLSIRRAGPNGGLIYEARIDPDNPVKVEFGLEQGIIRPDHHIFYGLQISPIY